MHEMHEYISQQIEEKLKTRRVVVWYDANKEFEQYIAELGADDAGHMRIGDTVIHLAYFASSFYALRLEVEPLVAGDLPAPLLIYIPCVSRDPKGSVLMELEKAGTVYEPQLKRVARTVLRGRYTDGMIDEMLAPERICYADIVKYLVQAESMGQPSILKAIFGEHQDSTAILATWLASDEHDGEIIEKEAVNELNKLIGAYLGLDIAEDTLLTDTRVKTIRYVLVGEFRADLQCEPPIIVGMIPAPSNQELLQHVRSVASRLRTQHGEAYVELADRIESELDLRIAALDAAHLGAVDTFRCEERILLRYCGDLIVRGEYESALWVIEERGHSFWVDRDMKRQAQWELCRPLAELGLLIRNINPALSTIGATPKQWVDAYTRCEGGWYAADQCQRILEAWITQLEEEPETEDAIGVIRRQYEDLLRKMAEGFSQVLQHAMWNIDGVLRQTRIYPEFVESGSGRVAYFLVDAMRYEMGADLARMLAETKELTVRPAIAMLPTITQIGMASLLPGASADFSVVEHNGRVVASIDGINLAGLQERMSYLTARIPGTLEMTLGKILQRKTKDLQKDITDAPLIVVRSQEIDMLGESSDDLLARQLMDTVVGNIARAVKKLSSAGVERFVITADHGYQFSLRKEEDMRTDNPGGNTLEIHRRCWVGHGGATPTGTVRVSGAELGYATDLDFIFPTGLGVFRTQGGLSYHHGGTSLQEIVIPVVSFCMPITEEEAGIRYDVHVTFCPDTITNRTFGIRVKVGRTLFSGDTIALRPILLYKGEQVGYAGMAIDAELHRDTGVIDTVPGTEASIGMMLVRDDCPWVRIVLLDPSTDVVLSQSDEITVKLGI